MTRTCLRTFMSAGLLVCGAAVPAAVPTLVGVPQPGSEVRKGADGLYRIAPPFMVEGGATVASGSVVESYLRADDLLKAKDLAGAIDVLESALKRQMDLSASTLRIEGASCEADSRSVTMIELHSHVRHFTYDLLDELERLWPDQPKQFERLSRICLGIPLQIAGATGGDFIAITDSSHLLSEATEALARCLKEQGKADEARYVAEVGEKSKEYFCKWTAPLMRKCIDSNSSIITVLEKVGLRDAEDACEVSRSMSSIETIIARRLSDGWARAVRKHMQSAVPARILPP